MRNCTIFISYPGMAYFCLFNNMIVVYISFDFIVTYCLILGMMAMGAINVVRGSRSSSDELVEIYNHSERFAKSIAS